MKKIIGYFKNMSILNSVRFFVVAFVLVMFGIVGIYTNIIQHKRIKDDAHRELKNSVAFVKEGIKHFNIASGDISDQAKEELSSMLYSQKYIGEGDAYVVKSNGDYLIHKSLSGANCFSDIDHKNRIDNKYGTFEFNNGENNIIQYFEFIPLIDAFVVIDVFEKSLYEQLRSNRIEIIIMIIVILILSYIISTVFMNKLLSPIGIVRDNIDHLSKGLLVDKIGYHRDNEVGLMVNSLNKVIDGNKSTASFAGSLRDGNLKTEYTPLSDGDIIGNSLLSMRDSLVNAKEQEEINKEQEGIRDWVNTGLAEFGDILRIDASQEELSYNIISNLVNYLEAIQGGLFLYDDSDKESVKLNLIASYAYSRKKFLEKEILLGEGLVGTCAIEKESIYITEIPDSYAEITSGLGDSAPRSILIVPLKLEDEIFGVIEIASLGYFEKYQREFVEKIGESIASTISNVKKNMLTSELLAQAKMQSEEMAAQEEEMRQNMEELQATQEESQRRENEIAEILEAVNRTVKMVSLDSTGKITEINDLLTKALGANSSIFINEQFTTIVKPSEGAVSNDMLWASLLNGDRVTRKEIVIANDLNIEVESTYNPIMNINNELERVLIVVG
jgi:signal transduction histidine kinase